MYAPWQSSTSSANCLTVPSPPLAITQVAIMLDTKGPEIRTGKLKGGVNVELVEGQDLTISTNYDLEGDNTTITCSYKSLPTSVEVGSAILVADGNLVLTVKSLGEE